MKRRKAENREIVTLTDLAPRQEITGGSRRVFGADAPLLENGRRSQSPSASQKTKDLAPKSPSKAKGGRLVGNSNFTLVRVTRSGATKSLPPARSPKSSKKFNRPR
jgi:hypothetical protein